MANLANPEQFTKVLPAQICIKIVDYQEKIHWAKTCHAYVYLNILSSSEVEAGSPRSQWPIEKKVPPLAAVNAKVVEAID